jgi:hypothetical protein
MSDKARCYIYLLMGLGSLAIAFYAFFLTLSLTATSEHYSSSFLLCSIMGVGFILVGAVNFYTAYAFEFGKVDEVVGSRESAVFIRSGRNVREGARIQLTRVMGADDLSLTDDQRRVLFISGWRPWVCPLSRFHAAERQ